MTSRSPWSSTVRAPEPAQAAQHHAVVIPSTRKAQPKQDLAPRTTNKVIDARARLHRMLIEEINLVALERLPKDEMRRQVHDFVSIGAAAPLQEAGAVAYRLPRAYYRQLASDYQGRRDRLCHALLDVGFDLQMPQGAYYVMADISAFGATDDVAFARHLVRERDDERVVPVVANRRRDAVRDHESGCEDRGVGQSQPLIAAP